MQFRSHTILPYLLFFIIFSKVAWICPSFADGSSDFYIQQATDRYFTIPQDARSFSMGGAPALTCRNAGCIFMNPAALGFIEHPSLSVSAGRSSITGNEFITDDEIELEDWAGYASVAMPLFVKGDGQGGLTISAAYSRYLGTTNDSLNTTPDGHRRSFGFGYALTDAIALGYGFHFLDDQLRTDLSDFHSHSRFLHHFTTQVKLPNRYTLGAGFRLGIGQTDTEDFILMSNGVLHLRQYTGEVALSKEWDQVSVVGALGYSRQTSQGDRLEFSPGVIIDGNETGNDYVARLGLEYQPINHLYLRGGLRYRNANYTFERDQFREIGGRLKELATSAGLGFSFKIRHAEISLDYGIEHSAAGYGNWEHLVTLSVSAL